MFSIYLQESAFKLAIELVNEEAARANSKVNLSIDFSSKFSFQFYPSVSS